MKDPRDIETVAEGATYILPKYVVEDTGLIDHGVKIINFVKGDKSNPKIHRQAGIMTESLLTTCGKYLQDVNKGPLENEDTQEAIDHIELALIALRRRADKRKAAGTQVTMKP